MEQTCPLCNSTSLYKLSIFLKDFRTFSCSECSELFFTPISALGEVIIKTIQELEIPSYQIYKFIKKIVEPATLSRRN